MARKSYSEEERRQVREALLGAAIQCIVEKGLIHSSVETLSRKAGISKSYFYTFFPSKEELVLEAIRCQQPRLMERARILMADKSLSRKEAVKKFLLECCCGGRYGVAVLSMEEEQEIYRYLKPENYRLFQQVQLSFYKKLLEIFGVPEGAADPKLIGNLALAMIMVYKGIPDSLPFLFRETADAMAEFQAEAIAGELERAVNAAAQDDRKTEKAL